MVSSRAFRRLGNIIISIILTLGIGFFIFKSLDLAALKNIFGTIRWEFLFISLVFFYGSLVARAFRFSTLLQEPISLLTMTDVMAAVAFFNGILPARTGELSYLYFLKKRSNVSDGENIASLIIGRIFDAVVAGLFAISAAYGMYRVGLLRFDIFVGAAGIFCFSFFIFLLMMFGSRYIRSFAFWVQNHTTLGKKIFFIRFAQKLDEMSVTFQRVRTKTLMIRAFASTILVWCLIFVFLWFLVMSLQVHISFWQSIFLFILPSIIGVLPIQPIGGVGLYEAALMFGFLVLGFNKDIALQLSIVIHAELLLMSLVFFLLSAPRLFRMKQIYESTI